MILNTLHDVSYERWTYDRCVASSRVRTRPCFSSVVSSLVSSMSINEHKRIIPDSKLPEVCANCLIHCKAFYGKVGVCGTCVCRARGFHGYAKCDSCRVPDKEKKPSANNVIAIWKEDWVPMRFCLACIDLFGHTRMYCNGCEKLVLDINGRSNCPWCNLAFGENPASETSSEFDWKLVKL